jgi:uncharacterized protein YoxC
MVDYTQPDVPIAQIQQMKMQGMSNNQIIQQLQRQGYSSTQVFDALSQASTQPVAPRMDPAPVPAMSASYGAPASYAPPVAGLAPGGSDTEEMIEAIIDEKWNDLLGDINKVVAWKDATEARITKLEQSMNDLRDSFGKLQQAVIGKVGEYDQHILEVGAEVKAMEKVFSKVLPVFTDNVAELSRVADQMKRNVPKK